MRVMSFTSGESAKYTPRDNCTSAYKTAIVKMTRLAGVFGTQERARKLSLTKVTLFEPSSVGSRDAPGAIVSTSGLSPSEEK